VTRREAGMYALLIGVLMFILIRAYVHYKAGFDWSQDWLSWVQDSAAVLAAVGVLLTWKELT
jgi:hypothetical protein